MTEEEKNRQGGEWTEEAIRRVYGDPSLQPVQTAQPVQPAVHQAEQPAAPADTAKSVQPNVDMSQKIEGRFMPGENTGRRYGTNELSAMIQNWKNRPETSEQKAAREKREARNRMFASIGDTVASIGNLVNTTQGSPNIQYKTSLNEQQQKRYDRMMAVRAANEKQFLDAQQKGRLKDIEQAYNDKEQRRKEEADRANMALKQQEQKLKWEKWKRESDPDSPEYRMRESKANTAAYNEETARVKSEYAERRERANLDRTNRTGRSGGNSGRKSQKVDYTDEYLNLPESARVKDRYGSEKQAPTQHEMEMAIRRHRQQSGSGSGWRGQSTQVKQGGSGGSGSTGTKKHELNWN